MFFGVPPGWLYIVHAGVRPCRQIRRYIESAGSAEACALSYQGQSVDDDGGRWMATVIAGRNHGPFTRGPVMISTCIAM